ncbi:MAG: 2-amino-4-hydroxy-6-hydroxymethyldihydropteridine diphosphokinase [Spirochaetota bacterium]
MSLVYVGLGSNLGDRAININKARLELLSKPDITFVKESSIEETDPVDYVNQPLFLNQIILVKTAIPPEKLLKIFKSIEKKLGRKKTILKGPRIIDIDILLYDDLIIKSQTLAIPHPEIKNRGFVLKHLLEIDANLIDPSTGIPYINFLKSLT